MKPLPPCAVASLFLLGGCAVGPNYRPPAMDVPAGFAGDHAAAPSPVKETDISSWWRGFDDPVLDDLILRAQRDNLDIRQAVSRVEQARTQERAARAKGWPSVNASAQGGYTRLSNTSLPAALTNLGNLSGGASSGSGGIGLPGESFSTFQTGFDASWELDLFGGQRRANEAARARTEAAVWSGRDAEVTITGEVANNYQQYRVLQRRIAILDEIIVSQRDLLDFIRVRSAKGLVTTLDERRQQSDVDRLAAQRADLKAEADADIHALGTLLGLPPTMLTLQLSPPQ